MTIKKAYYYFFYKLYRFWNKAYHPFLSGNFRAEVIIIALELFLISSLFIYYKIFFNRYIHLGESNWDIIICVLAVAIPNYYAFIHTDEWKEYCKEFDLLPKETNRRWGLWVWAVIVFIIANLIFSFYLMSQIDWSLYR